MATLKISDLSVGDWVQDNYGDYIKVAGMWQGCNFNYQVDVLRDGRIGTIVPCNIHPIPITAEILEKNGFEKISKTQPWFRYKTDITVARYADDLWGFGIGVACNELWGLSGVHDLQHAMRLAGVDKEINL